MINQLVLVGRLTSDPTIRETKDGKKVSNITVAVQRGFKNFNNEYDTDFLTCTLWEGIAENTVSYCKKGSIVGIKARLKDSKYYLEDEKYFAYPEIVAERIVFIST